jgi:tetratricopeptide (TPR) repeat protein
MKGFLNMRRNLFILCCLISGLSLADSPDALSPDEAESFYAHLREAREFHRDGKGAQAVQRIQAATVLAGRVYDADMRGQWLTDVVGTQIDIGRFDEALETAGYIRAANHRFLAHCKVAEAAYRQRETELAAKTIGMALQDIKQADPAGLRGVIDVATAAQAAGAIDLANDIASRALAAGQKIQPTAETRDAFGALAVFMVNTGKSDKALEVVKSYPLAKPADEESDGAGHADARRAEWYDAQLILYSQVAKAHAARGNTDQAEKALKAMQTIAGKHGAADVLAVRKLMETYLAMDRLGDARKMAGQLRQPEERSEAWMTIAQSLEGKADQRETALAILEKAATDGAAVQDDRQQQTLVLRAVRAMIRWKAYPSAASAAERIRQPQHRAMAFMQIAEARQADGQRDAAINDYLRARDVIESDTVDWRQNLTWKQLMLSMRRSELDDLAADWQKKRDGT